MRYPGTIVVEFLPPLPPGMERATFRREIVERIEAASARLVAEAAAAPSPPPGAASVSRAGALKQE
jgi:1-acyl-sn-glycerol-3-phosphate acyltransferase